MVEHIETTTGIQNKIQNHCPVFQSSYCTNYETSLSRSSTKYVISLLQLPITILLAKTNLTIPYIELINQ